MSLSAGLSSSTDASNATKISSGPIAFGSYEVNFAPPPVPVAAVATSSPYTWAILAAAAVAIVFFWKK